MVMGALLLTNCQEKQKQESAEADHEIPVSTSSEEALQNFNEGLALFDEGNGQKARPLFDKALELDPNFVSAQWYRAWSANSAKDWGENRDKFLAMRDQANEAEAIIMDYFEADKKDDEEKELETMKKLVSAYPKSARALVFLGDEYSGLEDHETGRSHYEKALELDEDFIPAINALGFSYMFSEPVDYEKCETYMAKAAAILPNSSKTHINLGDAYRAQNKLEDALASYKKATELDPEDEVTLSKAGHANTFLGNYEEARKNFQDSRAVSEFGTGAFGPEAFTYLYENGDYQKTLDFLSEFSAKIDGMDIPESNKTGAKAGCAGISVVIATHFKDSERLNEAMKSWKPLTTKQAEDVDSESARLYTQANILYWEGLAHVIEGEFEGASAKADMIKTTLEPINDPNKLRPYHRIHARVNFDQGNYDKALEHLAEMDESNIYDKYWTAKAHMKAGNTDKALEMFKELSTWNFNNVIYALIRNESIAIVESQNV